MIANNQNLSRDSDIAPRVDVKKIHEICDLFESLLFYGSSETFCGSGISKMSPKFKLYVNEKGIWFK